MKLFNKLFITSLLLLTPSCKDDLSYFEVYFDEQVVTSIDMYVGQELQLDVLTNYSSYSVSASASGLIAEEGGYLKAREEGTFTVVFQNDSFSYDLVVNVKPYIPLESFSIEDNEYLVRVGHSKGLNLSYSPSNASDKSYEVSITPNDGYVYVENGKVGVYENANPGNEYQITLTNERTSLMVSFNHNYLLFYRILSFFRLDYNTK